MFGRALWKATVGLEDRNALGVRFKDCGRAAPEIRYEDAPQVSKEPTKSEACAAWKMELLQEAGEPMRPKEVMELGKEYGFR